MRIALRWEVERRGGRGEVVRSDDGGGHRVQIQSSLSANSAGLVEMRSQSSVRASMAGILVME